MLKRSLLVGLAVLGLSDVTAQAVIVLGGDGRNELADNQGANGISSELQGKFGDYLGTPISATYFITARHIYNGTIPSITTTNAAGVTTVHPLDPSHAVAIGDSDLVLVPVTVPFATYATIYNPANDGTLLNNDALTVFGRGTDAGALYTAPGGSSPVGRLWGTADHAKSWGTNAVAGEATDNNGYQFLVGTFDNNGVATEGSLSDGDSGGGVFIFKNGQWRLAGINNSVALFRETAAGSDLSAAIFDGRGLYAQDDNGNYVLQPTAGPAVPQAWFASYVPQQMAFINATVPEPASLGLVAVGAMMLGRRRRT